MKTGLRGLEINSLWDVRFGSKADVGNLFDHLVGNSHPTHDRVIHSVDCFPRLSVMPVFVILKLISPFA